MNLYVCSNLHASLLPAGWCGARQPGAGPDPLPDHRLRLVSLWVKINLHYHNFMTSWRAVTASALADMNTLEAAFFFFFPTSSLCHLVGGDCSVCPRRQTALARLLAGALGALVGAKGCILDRVFHPPTPHLSLSPTLPLSGLFFSNYQPNLFRLRSSETVGV